MWIDINRSAIGTSHIRSSSPCQDYCASSRRGERTFVALADGAGSAKHSDDGSALAVECVLRLLYDYTGPLESLADGKAVSRWLEVIQALITIEAYERDAKPKEYASTLLFAAFEGNAGYFWQLGDGAWLVSDGRSTHAATWPSNGEYANETVFVTSRRAIDSWSHSYFSYVTGAIGFTDGLETFFIDFANSRPNARLARRFFSALEQRPHHAAVEEQVNQFIDSQLVNDRTDDDKTLCLVWNQS